MNLHSPDLRQHPPRSPRVRLGGYVILPRLLDKCRAAIADRLGEYRFDCPLDKRFLEFVGIEAAALRSHVELGAGDGEALAWIKAHSKHRRAPWEIEAWSAWQETRVPVDADGREYFTELHRSVGPHRNDIAGWFDLLDLDDHVSFGGKA